MAALILPSRRVVQPQGPVEVDTGNPLGRALGLHVSDFVGRDVVGQRFVTKTASLGYGVTAQGRGLSSAANAAFSAPLDLSSTNAITVAFIYKPISNTGTQVVFEHTVNINNQVGSCIVYFDGSTLEATVASGGGGFNVVRCPAPAVGSTTKILVTLERIGSTAKASRIWYDGNEQTTTAGTAGVVSGNFANSTSYFLGRAASSLFANGVIQDVSIWLRKISDSEVKKWSANPWQLFRPIQRRIWVSLGGATLINFDPASFSSVGASFQNLLNLNSGSSSIILTPQEVNIGAAASVDLNQSVFNILGQSYEANQAVLMESQAITIQSSSLINDYDLSIGSADISVDPQPVLPSQQATLGETAINVDTTDVEAINGADTELESIGVSISTTSLDLPFVASISDALNSIIYSKLRQNGYTGALNDMLKRFFGGTGSLQDCEKLWLISITGVATGTNQDLWEIYLTSLGYTGSLPDMLKDFWINY